MSRHRRGGWAGAGMWPFMMYEQQPGGGWGEQTMGMGFGQRPRRANGLCPPPNNTSGLDQTLSLESLSSLFTRLILQNHLTRLAGDTLGLGGRGVWECNIPAPSCSQPNTCSSTPSSSGCQNRPHACGQQASGCGASVHMCGHTNNTNNINVCHTCPAATMPYLTNNNVFVIPALQPNPGTFGNFNLYNNDPHDFHRGLGNGLNGLGGGGMGGPGMNNNSPTFSCRGCGLQMC